MLMGSDQTRLPTDVHEMHLKDAVSLHALELTWKWMAVPQKTQTTFLYKLSGAFHFHVKGKVQVQ